MDDRITVITVCFNSENEIESTLLSVLNQTYDNIEYIIVDGASKDGTLTIIETVSINYPNRRIIVKSEPDRGIYDAMNKGVNLSSGKWIIFMNSGDCFHDDNVISDCFKNYIDNGESIIYGRIAEVDSNKEYTGVIRYGYDPFFPACHQAIFTRTEELVSHPFDTSYRVMADYKFFYDLYKRRPNYYKTDLIIADYDNNGFSRNAYSTAAWEKFRFLLSRSDIRCIRYLGRYIKARFLS